MVRSRPGGRAAHHARGGNGSLRGGPAPASAHFRHRLPAIRRRGRAGKKTNRLALDFLDRTLPPHHGGIWCFSFVYPRMAGKSFGATGTRLRRNPILSPSQSDLAASHGRTQLSLSVSLGLVRMAGSVGTHRFARILRANRTAGQYANV